MLDPQQSQLFFRPTWEPFEAQFKSLEARFSNHTIAFVQMGDVEYHKRVLEYPQRGGEYC